ACTALTLSNTLAIADVSLGGSMQWHYISQDPGTITNGASNDYMHSDNKVDITFTNKTDSGLTISMFQTIRSNGTEAVSTAVSDGNSFLLEGGFGSVSFGNTGGIGDSLSPTAADLIGPGSTDGKAPTFYSSSGSLTSQQASLINIIDAENNITYTLPSIGGLTLGASYKDAGSGSSANDDETVVAGSYEFTSGEVTGSIVYANNSIEGATAGAGSTNSTSLGLSVTSGPISVIVAQAEDDQSTTISTEVNDYGISYAVDDELTLAVAGTEVEESSGGETLNVTSLSVKYAITSGLDAYLTYHDYDYAAGTSGGTADDGAATMFALEATF
ncbi:porin, partial [Alphaproteobacteria bacterium]|nr:porin [Alphaproteobacteria bacterium]